MRGDREQSNKIKDGHFTEGQQYLGEVRSDRRLPVGFMLFP